MDLVAYMETAQGLLAPDDADFHRKMGRFAGRRDRETRAFGVMLADPKTSAKMAPTLSSPPLRVPGDLAERLDW